MAPDPVSPVHRLSFEDSPVTGQNDPFLCVGYPYDPVVRVIIPVQGVESQKSQITGEFAQMDVQNKTDVPQGLFVQFADVSDVQGFESGKGRDIVTVFHHFPEAGRPSVQKDQIDLAMGDTGGFDNILHCLAPGESKIKPFFSSVWGKKIIQFFVESDADTFHIKPADGLIKCEGMFFSYPKQTNGPAGAGIKKKTLHSPGCNKCITMNLQTVDIFIILVYFVFTIFIGFYFTRMASRNLDAYFLGGKRMPWYVLSVSNASGMFDVSGTMWLVSMVFIYGMKGIWFPWLWPFFNQIFMMVYLSVWLRRSNVLTGAEWITTRFGKGAGARQSHIIVVIFALISVIGFLAYAFVGIGKFAKIFLPWDLSVNTYGIILMLITGVYVVLGGLFSVVATDVLQFVIMTICSFIIGGIALANVSPEAIAAVTPEGWDQALFGWRLDLDWSGIMDSVNDRIASDGVSLFGVFVMMMLFKGLFISAAGPIPSHDMQRILSNRSPKEAAKMSGMNSVILMIPRFMMVAGLTVLALVYFSPQLRSMGSEIDFELVLPYAVSEFVPVGIKGFLIAGLLAAFMSTISSYVNVAPAYLVNDIYKKYVNPNAGTRRYIILSYMASVLVLGSGIAFGFVIKSVDSITKWIVTALWAGYAAPNMLKWYWWRFNGAGFFWGMLSGLAASLVMPMILPDLTPIWHFPFVFVISLALCIAATLLTPPEEDALLKKFYTTVRPWGFWGPVREMVLEENPDFQANQNFKRDMLNVGTGIIWQLCIIAFPVYLVIQDFSSMAVAVGIILITSMILKKNWLDKLES